MYRICFLLAFSVILLVSCKNDDGNAAQSTEALNIYALTVGNSWEYEVEKYSHLSDSYEIVDLIITNSITTSTEINGRPIIRILQLPKAPMNAPYA